MTPASVRPAGRAARGRTTDAQAYHDLIHLDAAEQGGHPVTREEPTIFAEQLRRAFGPLR